MIPVGEAVAQRVDAAAVQPWRHAWLRPMQPVSGACFDGDTADDTGHFVIRQADTVVAIGSIFRQADERVTLAPIAEQWRLRGMATHPQHQNRGLGGVVLAAAMDWARDHDAGVVWCNARTPAAGFYRRHGFAAVGDEFQLPDIGPHYLMLRQLDPR